VARNKKSLPSQKEKKKLLCAPGQQVWKAIDRGKFWQETIRSNRKKGKGSSLPLGGDQDFGTGVASKEIKKKKVAISPVQG